MANSRLTKRWSDEARKLLKGKRIIDAEYLPDAVGGTVLQLTLDDGTTVTPMADDEGNEAGALFIRDTHSRNQILPVLK